MMIMEDDDDNHRFQIIIAVVNEALREVIQFEESGIGDNNEWLVSVLCQKLPTKNVQKAKLPTKNTLAPIEG